MSRGSVISSQRLRVKTEPAKEGLSGDDGFGRFLTSKSSNAEVHPSLARAM
jgi:hypothetical protein